MKTAEELNKLPPIGEVRLLDEDGNVIEKSPIREGRFSVTAKEDFFLLRFSIACGEYDNLPGGGAFVNGYPSIVVLTKIPEFSDDFKTEVPLRKEIWDEYDINYWSNYYDGIHTDFDYAELRIKKLKRELFSIKFSGKPKGIKNQDKVVGECELPLSETLKRGW